MEGDAAAIAMHRDRQEAVQVARELNILHTPAPVGLNPQFKSFKVTPVKADVTTLKTPCNRV